MSNYRLPDGSIPVLLSSDTADGLRAEAANILAYVQDRPRVTAERLADHLLRTRSPRRYRALILAAADAVDSETTTARAELLAKLEARVQLVPPVGYREMSILQRNARLIVTDSGGVQKEAYFARVPCVTLREETEWVELVAAGWNRLEPVDDAGRIHRALLEAVAAAAPTRYDENLFGDGCAAGRIGDRLMEAAKRCAA